MMLIFLVILLVFGAKRIPEIARGLGQGMREFKQATREISRELTLEQESPPYLRRDPHTIGRAPSTSSTTSTPHEAPPAAGSSKASGGEAAG